VPESNVIETDEIRVRKIATAVCALFALRDLVGLRRMFPDAVLHSEWLTLHRLLVGAVENLSQATDLSVLRECYSTPDFNDVSAQTEMQLVDAGATVLMVHPSVTDAVIEMRSAGSIESIVNTCRETALEPVATASQRIAEIAFTSCRVPSPSDDTSYSEPSRLLFLLDRYWALIRTLVVHETEAFTGTVPYPLTPLVLNVQSRIHACFERLPQLDRAAETMETIDWFVETLLGGEPDTFQACTEYTNQKIQEIAVFVASVGLRFGVKNYALVRAEEYFFKLAEEHIAKRGDVIREENRLFRARIELLANERKVGRAKPPFAHPADDMNKKDATREYRIKVENLKGLLVYRAVGGSPDEREYADLRRELVAVPIVWNALPEFVRRCSTIREFWYFIKPMFETDKHRRRTEYLQQEFEPVLEWLEGGSRAGGTGPRSASKRGRDAAMINVLLLSANPIDDPLGIDGEFRAIDAKIRGSEHRDHVQLINHGAVQLEDVPGLLMRHKPHIVHFSGHGNASGIALTTTDGSSKVVPPDALANIFRALKDNVRVVLLNVCDSASQAEAIVSVIDCAVGMADEIHDDAAVAFAAAFYEALGYGKSVETAFELALVQLTGAGEDRSLAKLYKRRGVKPSDIVLVAPESP